MKKSFLFSAVTMAFLIGCTTTQKGAAIGVAGGSVVGGIIGHQSGSGPAGAAIGAAVGGLGGALVGEHMDKKFCPACGAVYQSDVKYCPKDGTELKFKQ